MQRKDDTSGVHVWLVLLKAYRALAAHAGKSLNLSRAGLGDSDFRVLEALLHKGPLPVNTIGPKVWLTPGSISVAVDRLEKTALVKRKNTEDRRVRLVELTPRKGARSSPRPFGTTRPRWKRPPASSQERSGEC
jgi:MarR family transcriptional regulator, 2-MHQ and catechol-resistance regulon repressor